MSSNNSYSLLILFSLLLLLIFDSADLTVLRPCLSECGGVQIHSPFGVGEGCYLEKWYEIECVNTSFSKKFVPFLSIIRKEIMNISLPSPYGSVRIKNPITSKGCSSDKEELESLLNLTGTPFYVSDRNSLIAVGCNNTASLTDVEPSMVGCKSSCNEKYRTPTNDYLAVLSCNNKYGDNQYCKETSIMKETSCNGYRCCKANLPDAIQQIVGVRIDNTTTTTGECKVAFLTDEGYSLLNGSDPKRLHAKQNATVELRWFLHTMNLSFVDSLGCKSLEAYKKLKN